jgi:hypothetical protein
MGKSVHTDYAMCIAERNPWMQPLPTFIFTQYAMYRIRIDEIAPSMRHGLSTGQDKAQFFYPLPHHIPLLPSVA